MSSTRLRFRFRLRVLHHRSSPSKIVLLLSLLMLLIAVVIIQSNNKSKKQHTTSVVQAIQETTSATNPRTIKGSRRRMVNPSSLQEEKKEEAGTLKKPSGEEEDHKLDFLDDLRSKYSHQPVFLQCVEEIALSLLPLFDDVDLGGFYKRAFLTMAEPERCISFRVPWEDDLGKLHIQRGWRVEFSSVLGPYKGGLRFHPTVDEGLLKFLGFEQILKNALTGLPMGGGKGGSDFNPKGKSETEIKRFCQSFMTELYRYLGPNTDIPAGDIGVGGNEIGYMYGTYKRLTNRHGEGVLTGKSILFGGSYFRPEATGYGLVYITKLAVEKSGSTMKGKRVVVSGSGNVAQYASEKLLELGSVVLSVSDSTGCLFFPNGMTLEDLQIIQDLKNVQRGRLSQLVAEDNSCGSLSKGATYLHGQSVWEQQNLQCDIALPCATQNEIDERGAELLIKNGVKFVGEGANLPTTLKGQDVFRSKDGLVYLPAKAANAGGVGVSGLEMCQNAQKLIWDASEVDLKLQQMMADIYDQCSKNGNTLEEGANRAGFIKVATAMKQLGWVQ